MVNEPKPFSEREELQQINRKAGTCNGVCTFCDCADVVSCVLESRNLRAEDVRGLDVLPPELIIDITRAHDMKGERVGEGEDRLDISTFRPISPSFGAASDNEL